MLNCDRKVKGFVNYHKREMWSVDDMDVIMHEFGHIISQETR